MPFKTHHYYNRRRKTPKVQPKRNWSDYNKKIKMRGDVTIWLSPSIMTVYEKHGEISEKRNWRKLHVSVDQYNIIQTTKLTIRKTHDATVVDKLIAPMPNKVKQVTADTAYDANAVYHLLDNHFSHVNIVISPRNNATDEKHHHWMRNRNLREMLWSSEVAE